MRDTLVFPVTHKMPLIRKSQLNKMQETVDERFVERTMLRVKDAHTLDAEGLDDAILKERVKVGIFRARSHKLTWESSITGFVYLMFTVAPDFAERPAFRKILDDVTITDENGRMEALFERVHDEEWENARFQGDRTDWRPAPAEEQL
ncbi:MAG: hypothetical protein ABJF23_21115 [Bryobacteraceae bacterium]